MQQHTFQLAILLLAGITVIAIVAVVIMYSIGYKPTMFINTCPDVPRLVQEIQEIPEQELHPHTSHEQELHPQHSQHFQHLHQQSVEQRDRRVLSDPLYPALNRSSEQSYNATSQAVKAGVMYQQTHPDDSNDSFRLVGYISSTDQEQTDAGKNQWKMFGRMKDRNQGEYYISPVNNNFDMKIPLTQNVVIGEKLKDVYSLPDQMQFNSPLLNNRPYQFTELPRGDFGTRYT